MALGVCPGNGSSGITPWGGSSRGSMDQAEQVTAVSAFVHFSGRWFTVCFCQILKVCDSDSRLLVCQRLFSLAYPLPAP